MDPVPRKETLASFFELLSPEERAESEEERRWIKGSRYLLYKTQENLTGGQRPRLEKLLEVNQAIHTAYLLPDSLKEIWTLRSPWAVRRALEEWCEMAEQSGIGPLEGVSDKIKLIKRRSYGFRDSTYFPLKVKQAFPGN